MATSPLHACDICGAEALGTVIDAYETTDYDDPAVEYVSWERVPNSERTRCAVHYLPQVHYLKRRLGQLGGPHYSTRVPGGMEYVPVTKES